MNGDNLAYVFRKLAIRRNNIRDCIDYSVEMAIYIFDIIGMDYTKWRLMNERKDLYADELSWTNLIVNKRLDEFCKGCFAHVPTIGIQCDYCNESFAFERTFYVDDDNFVLEIIDVLRLNEKVVDHFEDIDSNTSTKYCLACVNKCNLNDLCVDCPKKRITEKIFRFDAYRLPLFVYPLFFDTVNVFNVEYSICKYLYGKMALKTLTFEWPSIDIGKLKNGNKYNIKNDDYINFVRLNALPSIQSYKTLNKQLFVDRSFTDETKSKLSGDSFVCKVIMMLNGFRWCRRCVTFIPDKGFTKTCDTCTDFEKRLKAYYHYNSTGACDAKMMLCKMKNGNFLLDIINTFSEHPKYDDAIVRATFEYLIPFNNFDTCVYDAKCQYCMYKCRRCSHCENRILQCVGCKSAERDLMNSKTFDVYNGAHKIINKLYIDYKTVRDYFI